MWLLAHAMLLQVSDLVEIAEFEGSDLVNMRTGGQI
jgi:hypothetical protein